MPDLPRWVMYRQRWTHYPVNCPWAAFLFTLFRPALEYIECTLPFPFVYHIPILNDSPVAKFDIRVYDLTLFLKAATNNMRKIKMPTGQMIYFYRIWNIRTYYSRNRMRVSRIRFIAPLRSFIKLYADSSYRNR